MEKHICEHLRIGCNVAIPQGKKGEPSFPSRQDGEEPCSPCFADSSLLFLSRGYQPFLLHTSSKVTILGWAGGREERKSEIVRNDYESCLWESSYSANS